MRDLSRRSFICTAVLSCSALSATAQVTVPSTHIYAPLELAVTTQNCIAATAAGTFVGVGTAFTANGQSVVLASESGALRLVAYGLSSIGDCVYDATTDTLYVTDNADNADLGITTSFGNTAAQSGDTVFAIPNASTASGLAATDIELLPANSIEFAANIEIDSAGTIYVGDAAGSGGGSVIAITPGPTSSTFVSGFDFTGGLAFDDASGDLFVGESLSSFDTQIRRFDGTGTPVAPDPFAPASFAYAAFDLAFTADGDLLATGAFAGDVTRFSTATGTFSGFISGLTFASGASVHPTTGRIELLSSTFTGAAEDRSIHRFIAVDTLVAGAGSAKSNCLHEFYGVELDPDSKTTSTCTDGATCDTDGIANGQCAFRLGSCFNVNDPDLGQCDANDSVTAVTSKLNPFSATAQGAYTRAAAALPISTSQCFFGDGYVVPVKINGAGITKEGRAKLKVKVESSDGRKDTDTLKLVCQPAP